MSAAKLTAAQILELRAIDRTHDMTDEDAAMRLQSLGLVEVSVSADFTRWGMALTDAGRTVLRAAS